DAKEWICELCRSKLFDPFFKVVQNFGTPHFLRFNTPRLQTVYFDLTPLDLDGLRQYRGTEPGSVELQLRCFVINHNLSEGHEWPTTTQVNVNGFSAQITQRASPGQTNVSKVLRELPLNLGQFCRPGRNTIELRANDTYGYLFAFVIQRVVREALTSLINVVVNNSKNITYESAKQNVIASFGNEDDDIVAMSTLLSVRCPLGLCVIEFPARGIHCQHLQCFDLKTFLMFNKTARSRAWKCTVCNQFIALNDLRIDPFLKDLLSQVADDEELESVEIFPDATWKKRVEEDEPKTKKPKVEETQSNRTVNDALDDFDSPKPAPNSFPAPAPTIESIDLTLSSDEENDDIPLIGLVPPSKPSNAPSNSLWPSSSNNSWPNNQNNSLPQLGVSLSNQLDFVDFYPMANESWADPSSTFNTESEAFTNIRNPIIDVLSSPIPTINPVSYRPLPPLSPDRSIRQLPVMAAPAPPITKAILPAVVPPQSAIENTPVDALPITNGCPAVSPPRRFPPVSSFFTLVPRKASPP
ncbi:SUMO ligase, partial [Thraustotheca clavata]